MGSFEMMLYYSQTAIFGHRPGRDERLLSVHLIDIVVSRNLLEINFEHDFSIPMVQKSLWRRFTEKFMHILIPEYY